MTGVTDRKLVIVESPAKAKTISRFLGNDYDVEASVGHIRDLAQPSDLPAELKKTGYAKFAVDLDNDFEPYYVVDADKKKKVSDLKARLKDASELFLATDEDREGEAIAWHLLEVLKPKVPVKRMVFHEITKDAIDAALAHPRDLDQDLVNAQEARRILDRLVGYEVSPLLWRKIRTGLSAGRVQSVATRLVVDRERERIAFKPAEYWDLVATLQAPHETGANGITGSGSNDPTFDATLKTLDGKRVATGKDLGDDGKLTPAAQRAGVVVLSQAAVTRLGEVFGAPGATWIVTEVESKPYRRRPPAPFTTSSLQQEASRKLRMNSRDTMRVAQTLYENGYITYMRTDSVNLSDQAIHAARSLAVARFGADSVPAKPRRYETKAKGAQEAHEAIRPAGEHFRDPASLQGTLTPGEWRLYHLIYQRTLACQMVDATGTTSTVHVEARNPDYPDVGEFGASGTVISEPGFLAAYQEGRDATAPGQNPDYAVIDSAEAIENAPVERFNRSALSDEVATAGDAGGAGTVRVASGTADSLGAISENDAAAKAGGSKNSGKPTKEREVRLPRLAPREPLNLIHLDFSKERQHFTTPPARFTDATLVKAMEERGIGRPSTYASTISTIVDRSYVYRRGQALVPSWLAFSVVRLLEENLPGLVDFDFTADMETDLDKIAAGDGNRSAWLRDFWYGTGHGSGLHGIGLQRAVEELGDIDAAALNSVDLGEGITLRVGRYGPYLQRGEERASVPETIAPDELTVTKATELLAAGAEGERILGRHPQTGLQIVVKNGRFGPYVEEALPEPNEIGATKTTKSKRKTKPRTASLLKTQTIEGLTLEQAVDLLSLPRVVGVDADGVEILAANGRYGPYIKRGTDTRSLETEAQLFTLTVAEALALLAAPKTRRASGTSQSVMAEFGDDPETGKPVKLKNGRFGPYVTDGTTNATVPRGTDPATLSESEAFELLAAKRAKGPVKRRASTKKTADKKTATKKTADKKTAAKKTADKKTSTAKKTTPKTKA